MEPDFPAREQEEPSLESSTFPSLSRRIFADTRDEYPDEDLPTTFVKCDFWAPLYRSGFPSAEIWTIPEDEPSSPRVRHPRHFSKWVDMSENESMNRVPDGLCLVEDESGSRVDEGMM